MNANTIESNKMSTRTTTETTTRTTTEASVENNRDSDYITLRALRAMVDSTEGKALPRRSELKASGKPVATYIDGSFRIDVYKSGFALARNGHLQTIVRVDEGGGYSYNSRSAADPHGNLEADQYFRDKSRKRGGATGYDIDEAVFLDQPWPIKLLLLADDRMTENADSNERRWLNKHHKVSDENNELYGPVLSVEDDAVMKITVEEAMKTLTEKQRRAVYLYHFKGYTQAQIAEMEGVSQKTIGDRLAGAYKTMRAVLRSR